MRSRALLLASVVALAVPLTACGSGESAAPTVGNEPEATEPKVEGPDLTDVEFDDESGQASVEVQARDNNYVAPFIEIDAGTTVEFINKGRNQHNVLPSESGAFASIEQQDFEPKGGTGSVTFQTAGDYPYYCSLHGSKTKGMVGVVRVLA